MFSRFPVFEVAYELLHKLRKLNKCKMYSYNFSGIVLDSVILKCYNLNNSNMKWSETTVAIIADFLLAIFNKYPQMTF